MLADMLAELHFKQLLFFSWNYEYFYIYQILLKLRYIYKSIPSNQYIFYNRDNFLNFLYIQKLLKLLCFPPTSLQISRPFDSLPFIWFILFYLLRIFANNKSNTQIYQPRFNAEYQIPTSNDGCWTIKFFGFCRLLFKVEIRENVLSLIQQQNKIRTYS